MALTWPKHGPEMVPYMVLRIKTPNECVIRLHEVDLENLGVLFSLEVETNHTWQLHGPNMEFRPLLLFIRTEECCRKCYNGLDISPV